jgi:uncharacterized protein (TIGR02271 family)
VATKHTTSQFQASQIQTGWDVYGSDGEKIGDVADIGTDSFIIKKGFFFPTDIYVPMSAVTAVEHDEVRLSMTKAQIEAEDWSQQPDSMATDADYDRAVAGHGERGTSGTLERKEEQLRVQKQPVQTGEVRVEKDVVEQQQSIDVPLRKEEVHIQRRAVDKPASGDAFQEQEISVPVTEERAHVDKESRVVEELDVEKEVREDTERVSGTVKKERFKVDGEGQADLRTDR